MDADAHQTFYELVVLSDTALIYTALAALLTHVPMPAMPVATRQALVAALHHRAQNLRVQHQIERQRR